MGAGPSASARWAASRPAWSRPALLAGGALVGLGLYAGLVAPRRFVVTRAQVTPRDWPAHLDGLRVAVIGDLHVGAPGVGLDRVRALVRRVAGLDPDLVLLAGDHIADVHGARAVPIGDIAAALAGLLDVAPVVGVLGNHDWYAGGARVRTALEAAGLTTLEEQAVAVPLRGGELWVAGVGDVWERRPDVAAALAGVPSAAPTLLLSHNPDAIVEVPSQVALTLSGHTHGGQFTAFGRPFHQVSPRSGNRFLRGRYDVGGRPLYVTSGVGTSLWPVRLGVPPEIALLTLSCTRAGRVLNLS